MDPLVILIDEKSNALWAAAVASDGWMFTLDCDVTDETVRWGSVFIGKVATIDKKLDACWVDLGERQMGLLPRREWPNKDKAPEPGTTLLVQAKSSMLKTSPEDEQEQEQAVRRKIRLEPKVARLSTDITLPGRYLILATQDPENRLSRRIRDRSVRRRMMHMLDELKDSLSGCILRSAAESVQTDVLMREGRILQNTWKEMQETAKHLSEPQELMKGPNAIERLLSDVAGCTIERIEISLLDHMNKVEAWCETFAPDLVTKIEPLELANATEDFALFDHYDLLPQIEDLLQPYVLLSGGGNLVIQETAALIAVDVNRGGDVDASNLEINREAAIEVGRQLRLRNLSGIVMVDFLKTKNKKDEGIIISAIEDAVQLDACTVQIHGMTALGLMELTRQRRLPPLRERIRGF